MGPPACPLILGGVLLQQVIERRWQNTRRAILQDGSFDRRDDWRRGNDVIRNQGQLLRRGGPRVTKAKVQQSLIEVDVINLKLKSGIVPANTYLAGAKLSFLADVEAVLILQGSS